MTTGFNLELQDVGSELIHIQSTLDVAREYVRRGFSVIPLEGGGKKPVIAWKELQSRYPTDEELVEWFLGGETNIGIVTGEISGITVLDIDSDKAFEMAQELGLPLTPRVRTGKGWHYYFAYAPGVGNFQKRRDLPDIDLRGDGGYVVAPPSIHVLGVRYEWADEALPRAPLPSWVTEQPSAARHGTKRLGTAIFGVPEGTRDQTLFQYACILRARGLSHAEAEILVQQAAARCTPPFSAELAADKVRRAYKYEGKARPLTDAGNAERIADLYGNELRYVPGKGWHIWDGRRWKFDDTDRIYVCAITSARLITDEPVSEGDDDLRGKRRAWARKSESRGRLSAAIDLASKLPLLVLPASKLDRDPWLLNVRNGTVDICTGELRPHDPAQFITRIADVDFDPIATAPNFRSLLQRVVDDEPTSAFLQSWFGYCLTGETSAQKIVILCGAGANGKSTIIDAVRHVLGEYAVHVDGATLTSSNSGGGHPRSDLARLNGVRLADATEIEPTAVLNEPLLKAISGGDPITARGLFEKNEIEFTPTFKLLIAANAWPQISGTDEGIWRRLMIVPFTITIPEIEQDRDLPRKLHDEAAGILNWMLEGIARYRSERGLVASPRIVAANRSWRESSDPVGMFIKTRLTRATVKIPNERIRQAFEEFCSANDQKGDESDRKRKEAALWRAMKLRGFEPYRTGSERGWYVALRDPG